MAVDTNKFIIIIIIVRIVARKKAYGYPLMVCHNFRYKMISAAQN
jgi:hypothetical protein